MGCTGGLRRAGTGGRSRSSGGGTDEARGAGGASGRLVLQAWHLPSPLNSTSKALATRLVVWSTVTRERCVLLLEHPPPKTEEGWTLHAARSMTGCRGSGGKLRANCASYCSSYVTFTLGFWPGAGLMCRAPLCGK